MSHSPFQKGQGDANDVWRVEILGGRDGDVVETVTSRVKFHHYFLKCVLTVPGKQLPKWGFEQQEVACNPTARDPAAVWNVEDNFYPRREFEKSCKCLLQPAFFIACNLLQNLFFFS